MYSLLWVYLIQLTDDNAQYTFGDLHYAFVKFKPREKLGNSRHRFIECSPSIFCYQPALIQ